MKWRPVRPGWGNSARSSQRVSHSGWSQRSWRRETGIDVLVGRVGDGLEGQVARSHAGLAVSYSSRGIPNNGRPVLRPPQQKTANLSVTEFGRQFGVSFTTFYYWKKRVREAPLILSQQVPVRSLCSPPECHRRAAPSNFVHVSIDGPSADAQLEIELTNACVLRLGCD